MKHLLAPANIEVLRRLARRNVLIALDYDGTLAPIVDDPQQAVMRESTRALLGRLARLYPSVVITGRARADAERLLDIPGLRAIVGNHGMEPSPGAERFADDIRRFRSVLERHLAGMPGVLLEDKHLSLAVHFRNAPRKRKVRAAVLAAAGELGDVRLFGGKQVINVTPGDAPNKGTALRRECERLGCDVALYCGDDVTDEDVFAQHDPERVLGVRIGASRRSRARYYLRSQEEVDDLLRELIDARSSARPHAELG